MDALLSHSCGLYKSSFGFAVLFRQRLYLNVHWRCCSGTAQARCAAAQSLAKFRVFGLGLDEDGDVGVGVFPKSEEILIGGTGGGLVTASDECAR